MRAVVVLNQSGGQLAAGGPAITPDDVAGAFRAAGVEVCVRPVHGADFTQTVAAAVREPVDAVIVGGGDGSVNTAAQHLADNERALGVLPLGTLNHFAKDLGLPVEWREAVLALARGRVRRVDVGEVNGRFFINNCSLGAYPQAVLRRDELRNNGRGKWLAMALAVLAEFVRLRRIRFELELPDRLVRLRSPFVLISNNRYTGRVLAQRLRPRLDEGKLWVYTTRADRRFQFIRMMWQTLVHSLDEADGLETEAIEAASIATRQARLPVALDGEVVDLRVPLRFRMWPAALRVLTPPGGGSVTGAMAG